MSGIFGNTASSGSAGTSGGGLFGTGNAAGGGGTGANTGGLFGNTAKPSQGGSIFGSGGGGSGGLFGSSTSTPAGGAGLFGSPMPPTTANASNTTVGSTVPQPSTNPLFGGSTFSLPKPDQGSKDEQKPATPNHFGQLSNAAAASSTTTAPTFGGSLFGAPAKSENSTANTASSSGNPASSATATTGSNAFPSGGLFGKPATPTASIAAPGQAASGASASTSTSVATGFSLPGTPSTSAGGLFGAPKPAEKKDEKPTAAPSLTGSLFGAPPKPDEQRDTTTTGLSGGVLLGTKENDKNSSGGSAAPIVAVPPPSMLRGKTIEEIVNKWHSELETHVREFNKFAAEVSMWDRALIENGNNLAALYSHVLQAEREQNEVDQSLDHIEQQQKDLAVTLDSYEKVTEEIFGGAGGSLRALDTGPADTERDKNYMLATDLHTHLDDLSKSLTQMIDSVNSLSIPAGSDVSSEDPMAQISQILSTHLESLQWIDSAVREVEGKVTEVEKRIKDSGHATGLNGSSTKQRGFGPR